MEKQLQSAIDHKSTAKAEPGVEGSIEHSKVQDSGWRFEQILSSTVKVRQIVFVKRIAKDVPVMSIFL